MENGILQPPWSSDVLGLRIEARIDSTGAAPNKLSWSRRENSAKRRKETQGLGFMCEIRWQHCR